MNKFIFDFGGVVVRWSMDDIMNSIDRNKEEKRLIKNGLFKHNDWQLMDRGELSHIDVINNASQRLSISKEIIKFYFYSARDYVIQVDEIYNLILEIKKQNFQLYGLSNMSENFYQFIKNYPVFNLFDGIVWSYQENLIKPEKDIWLTLLNRYKLNAQECVFIDDMKYNIDVAKELNFKTVHFTQLSKIEEIKKYMVKND